MKILTLHCDYIKFKPLKKAIKNPEAIRKTAEEVKAKNIVLYPYAHLSSKLSSTDVALKTLEEAEKILAQDFKVTRAPFGYYKTFELKCKGHPLSELSKEFHPEGYESQVGGLAILKEEVYNPEKLLKEISRSKLDTSKLKDNDHRILGQKLDLFSFNEVAPGMVFWHNNGLIIYNELINYWRELHRKAGYQEISTPQILDKKLWQISGHWEKYKENIFLTNYEGRSFAVKPMNCPGGMLVYKANTKSYKDLPLRVGELGVVHRTELSGVLAGLFRVIQFTQDDAHIFCTEDQIEEEVYNLLDLVDFIYKKFGFNYKVELSTRPEKRIGSNEIWDKAEKALEAVLKKRGAKYKVNAGGGAFYGPKIDFHLTDSLNRTWQCGTIQLDFSMPERFEIEYTDRDNSKKRPVMLHNAIYGSLERFIGILLEHTNGALPLWLSPVQVRVIDFTERNTKAAQKIVDQLKESLPGLRIDSDFRNTTVSDKVRDAEMQKIPYTLVIGDKEEQAKTLAVRERGSKPKFGIKIDDFIKDIKEKIESRNA